MKYKINLLKHFCNNNVSPLQSLDKIKKHFSGIETHFIGLDVKNINLVSEKRYTPIQIMLNLKKLQQNMDSFDYSEK